MTGKSNGTLQEAMALLIQNQAQFVAQLNEHNKRQAESDRRFALIEGELTEIKDILIRHETTLRKLPETIRQKVGFGKSK